MDSREELVQTSGMIRRPAIRFGGEDHLGGSIVNL